LGFSRKNNLPNGQNFDRFREPLPEIASVTAVRCNIFDRGREVRDAKARFKLLIKIKFFG